MERDVLRALPSLRPTMRLGVARKVDKLSTVRIGSARYSVPHLLRGQHVDVTTVDDRVQVWHQGQLVAEHRLVPPGSSSILDDHYDKPTRVPARAVRLRTKVELAFLALGQDAVFLGAAAAAALHGCPPTSRRSPPSATRRARHPHTRHQEPLTQIQPGTPQEQNLVADILTAHAIPSVDRKLGGSARRSHGRGRG